MFGCWYILTTVPFPHYRSLHPSIISFLAQFLVCPTYSMLQIFKPNYWKISKGAKWNSERNYSIDKVYRGKLIEAEDNMNSQMASVTVTFRSTTTKLIESIKNVCLAWRAWLWISSEHFQILLPFFGIFFNQFLIWYIRVCLLLKGRDIIQFLRAHHININSFSLFLP